jgi:hypothetical protein
MPGMVDFFSLGERTNDRIFEAKRFQANSPRLPLNAGKDVTYSVSEV